VLRGSRAYSITDFKISFSQAKLPVDPDVMTSLLQMSDLRSQFLAWLASEMRFVSQKQNKLAWLETLDLKTGGASTSALKLSYKKTRCIPSSHILLGHSFPKRLTIVISVATLNNSSK